MIKTQIENTEQWIQIKSHNKKQGYTNIESYTQQSFS